MIESLEKALSELIFFKMEELSIENKKLMFKGIFQPIMFYGFHQQNVM